MKMYRLVPALALCATACGTAPPPPPPPLAKASSPPCPPPPAAEPDRREGFVVTDAWPKDLDEAAFERLLSRAKEEQSTALIVVHDGKLIHASNPLGKGELDMPSFAMSVTKSVVALLIGTMVDDGVLELDQPLSEKLVPEWKDTDKAPLTLRHLLNHASGLDTTRAISKAMKDGKIIGPWNIETTGLGAELVSPIGTKFQYNNQAVDFLSVLVHRVYGDIHLDDALQKLVFADLGVLGAFWGKKDEAGHPHAAGEILMRPIDLAKVGQLVLDGGTWQGKRLLSERWMTEMLKPGQSLYDGCGLLWWRNGRKPPTGEPFEPLAYRADGYLGQYIIVVPDKRLVAVRMRDPKRTSWDPDELSYKDFMWDVLALAGHDIPEDERR